jgi:hypothetical protein
MAKPNEKAKPSRSCDIIIILDIKHPTGKGSRKFRFRDVAPMMTPSKFPNDPRAKYPRLMGINGSLLWLL